MSGVSWLAWLIAAAAAFTLAGYLYRFRELPGRGRGVLIALRGAVLALLLLLLFDPSLAGPAGAGAERLVLLDASSSMALPAPAGAGSRWAAALERARSAGADDLLLFGDAPRAARLAGIDTAAPRDTRSRLLPALQAAAQSGARRVTLITDARLDDAEEVARWLPRLGLSVDLEDVGGDVANGAITRVSAPSWVETGHPLDIEFEVMAVGAGPDSLAVRVLREGVEAGRARIARPGPGRFASGSVRVVAGPADSSRWVRYTVALDPGDDAAADDARHVYLDVSAQPAGVTLVSFQPDWEPRFLFPVLERALGLPVRAFMRMGPEWVELGAAPRAGHRAGEADVLESVARAQLVVVHGADEHAPGAFTEALVAARRILVFPAGTGRFPGLPLPLTSPIAADWYVSGQIPSSPIASALAGLDIESVPPLFALRIPDEPEDAWAALNVNRARRGATYAIAIGRHDGPRRWVAALGQGYWRWSLKGGESRATYERLWSAIGGWLLEESMTPGVEPLEPVDRILEPGSAVRWVSPGTHPDSLRLQIADSAGTAVADTVLKTAGADSAATPALPPGRYRYSAAVFGPGGTGEATGEFTVESATTENIRASAADRLNAPLSEMRASARRAGARPLHAVAWPWIALILLLCAEWILRRRWGLR